MNLLGIHFLRPWWFLLLIVIVAWLWILWKKQQQQHAWQAYCDPELLQHVMHQQQHKPSVAWLWLFALLLLSIMLALTGPSWHRLATPVYKKAIARVVVLDLSESMLANDLPPNRLQRAKYKILDLLKTINEGQTGMLVFSSQAFVVSPLTDDSNTIAAMVPTLNTTTVPVQGSNIQAALTQAGKLLKQAGAERGTIILITDSVASKAAEKEARSLASEGYHLAVMGIGTAQGGPIPKQGGGFITNNQGAVEFAKLPIVNLEQLAKAGGGVYVPMTDNDTDIKTLLAQTNNDKIDQKMRANEKDKVMWRDDGHWFVWLALLFLSILARRGWLEQVLR